MYCDFSSQYDWLDSDSFIRNSRQSLILGGISLFVVAESHTSLRPCQLYENLDSRAPDGFPDRNIGNQRRRIFALPGVKKRRLFEGGTTEFLRFSLEGQKFPPTFPVPIREAVGGGMVPFS